MLLPITLDLPPQAAPTEIVQAASLSSIPDWALTSEGELDKSGGDPRAEFPDNRQGTGGPVPRAPRK